MSDSPFVKYASGELSPDETYTVELLINGVRPRFDDTYWKRQSDESAARANPDYQPSFSKEHLGPAVPLLEAETWFSLQRNGNWRPVRSVEAFRHLPNLTGLVLIDNEVSDLTPLGNCTQLRQLLLKSNPVGHISPLVNCRALREVELTNTPVSDLSVLEELPELEELTISDSHIPAFRRLTKLGNLRRLWIHGEFDSFLGFPEMPSLRVIIGAEVNSLEGLDQFTNLREITNFSGGFKSVLPLRGLQRLTHFNAWGTRVTSVNPLASLVELRRLSLKTEAEDIDLSTLRSLPALHDLRIECDGQEPESLAKVRANLTSWDVEFLADKPRYTPSLEVEVLTDEAFENFIIEASYGVKGKDFNEGLLGSELDWLERRLEKALSARFRKEKNYSIPFQPAVSRSLTVMLLSTKAVKAFPQLVLAMQKVLATARNDYILCFQSDLGSPSADDFQAWVYPNKIQVTEKYAATVQRLIKPRGLGRFFGL